MRLAHAAAYPSRRSPVLARNVVAASQPLATQAGVAILRQGGNALDAALASAIALTVVEPTGNGLGSDAFCILWDGGELHGLNASGRAPAAVRFDAVPERGWGSVTVPGAVAAWADLSARFGRLPFADLFAPAIGYAEGGYPVSPVVAELWRRGALALRDQPGFAEAFTPKGRAPRAGETFACPDLGRSLRLIAESRGRAFYEGELAAAIADHAARHGGAVTKADLAAHANEWCGTIERPFAGSVLHEIPPNGQGIAALMALGMLEHLGAAGLDPNGADALHLQIEAMKLAFHDVHAHVADPAYMGRVTAADLLDEGYLKRRAKLIERGRAQAFGPGAPKAGGTVCLATGDRDGMMVSFIQSNYMGFGSGVVVPGTGISLQNRGAGFTAVEGHPNAPGPGKRPFHTIIPGFVTRGGVPAMAFGLMGGPMQAQGHVQMVLRTQASGQDPQTAADAPRWRVIEGLDVAVEQGFAAPVMAELAARGHRLAPNAPDAAFGFGGAQLVCRLDDGSGDGPGNGYAAGSDPRKDGAAAGF